MSRNVDTLVRALLQWGVITDPDRSYSVARTYAGCHQRSDGAWSFELLEDGKFTGIGSGSTLSECAKAARDGRISVYENDFTSAVSLLVEREPSKRTKPPLR